MKKFYERNNLSRSQGNGHDGRYCYKDFYGTAKVPEEPTSCLPGSIGKMKVMRERAERQEQLFHPLDARSDVS